MTASDHQPPRVSSRLAAILAADVAGYTRLMGDDGQATLAAWWASRSEVIDPEIAAHQGRIVKHTGDGFLVEFATASAAVACGTAIQQRLTDPSWIRQYPDFLYRIGINIGEIVADDEDVYGNGVNLAARIMSLAEPGSLWISANIHEQLSGKLQPSFEDTGNHWVKNVDHPLHCFRLLTGRQSPQKKPGRALDFGPLSLPEKPSIAVLPFENLSRDQDQEFFSDGIAEEIITALSHFRELFVIARNSSFCYRNTPLDARKIGQELGVKYLLEGSVRQAANRVRVTIQLIEAESGNQIWAERYDRPLDDIFLVQDEITAAVVTAVGRNITLSEAEKSARHQPREMGVWQLTARAEWYINSMDRDSLTRARELCLECIRRYPASAPSYSLLAFISVVENLYGYNSFSPENPPERTIELARKAMTIDSDDERARIYLAYSLWVIGRHDAAHQEAQSAVKLNPNSAAAFSALGIVHAYSGSDGYDQAVVLLDKAMRLSPRDPFLGYWCMHRGVAELLSFHLEAAEAWFRRSLQQHAQFLSPLRLLAATTAHRQKIEKARQMIRQVETLEPSFNLQQYRQRVAPAFRHQKDFDYIVSGLQLAGARER
ncbi:MAG: hypothetical protein HQL48_02305 [Gammaproteobacteria bacterium]|nr:hypothetical protein [Gammaproteobacteria bacterium]